MSPTVRYPAGPVTPHGAYHILKGNHPMVALRAYDDSTIFHLMGGRSIPDRTMPESVQIKRDGLKGLIPPWKTIDQKTATQDGVTFVDALYDPMEVEATVIARGRSPKHTRRVVRDLIASLDVKQKSELSWFTQELGRWWAPVRWLKAPPNKFYGSQLREQELTLSLRADDAFWRSYDHSDAFTFSYEDMVDSFDYVAPDLGPNWPQRYTGEGGGFFRAVGGEAKWFDDPLNPILPDGREVVNGPYKDFSTDTDNQVITITLGSLQELTLGDTAYNDLWGRMGRNPDGTWNGDGIRARIGGFVYQLSRFNNFVETVMAQGLNLWPPMWNDKFTLICGEEDNTRRFTILRNGFPALQHQESGEGSELGAAWRGIGFGVRAGAALITQTTPANVTEISAGDNATVSQSGFVTRLNVGDQPMWDRFTCFGPGTFFFANGPGSTDMVKFGPLLPNQVMQVRTDPRKYGVVDLTSIPPTPQELNWFQQALKDFYSFATGNNVPPLYQAIESQWGIAPPQGNPYSLLDGRFSNPIPPKSPGNPAKPYKVKVAIDDGNASSKIVVTGTPLRRYPQ